MKSRNLYIFIGAVIGCSLLFMVGCKTLVKSIYFSMDCDRFNIDHIELRTGIDIPQITRNYCELSDEKRTVSFQLLKTGTDKAEYAQKYFTWNDEGFFKSEGMNDYTVWTATLDTVSNELIFKLHYR